MMPRSSQEILQRLLSKRAKIEEQIAQVSEEAAEAERSYNELCQEGTKYAADSHESKVHSVDTENALYYLEDLRKDVDFKKHELSLLEDVIKRVEGVMARYA